MYLHAKFRYDVSQFTAVLSLLLVSENGRPPYWNSTCSFRFDLFVVIGVANCIGVPDFIQVGQRTVEL